MRPILEAVETALSPEGLAARVGGERGLVLLRTRNFQNPGGRYSFVTARPFATFRSSGSRLEFGGNGEEIRVQFGNPWHALDVLMARYELLDELDLPFPLGGCFGFWGYDLRNFVEPRLTRRAINDLELPDCQVGFYDSLVVWDHALARSWIVSTGVRPDGSRDARAAHDKLEWWRSLLTDGSNVATPESPEGHGATFPPMAESNLSQEQFVEQVRRAQRYIRSGDIYQVNLARRLCAAIQCDPWWFFQRLADVSPAPFAAFVDWGSYQISSSSPEMFIRLSGSHIVTRPIKGTRPRSGDSTRDAQWAYELQTSGKELAELVMITDLLRNDLGRVCEYGTVQVPELARLERYAQVQHLVSTVEGRLRPGVTHFEAFAKCFPGGSITGAPKIRAMEIIDELEPVTRGPYTGCLGYLGFNRESQLSIAIRTAVHAGGRIYFHVGAGIVADSIPEAEYEETQTKAGGFLDALRSVAACGFSVRRRVDAPSPNG